MSVDMFEHRFRQELEKVERFEPQGRRDKRVWQMDFPAWRALFTSQCLHGHSTGYQLFSFQQFFDYCKRAYCDHHPNGKRFRSCFSGELLAGMQFGLIFGIAGFIARQFAQPVVRSGGEIVGANRISGF